MKLQKMGQIEIKGGGDVYMLMETGALKIGAVHNERWKQWKMRLLSATNTHFESQTLISIVVFLPAFSAGL